MKKTVCFMLILVMFFTAVVKGELVQGGTSTRIEGSEAKELQENEKLQKSISSKLIRFHVIANSDNVEDQRLKLKVRDKVLEYIAPRLKTSSSIEQSREILKKNDNAIKSIAEKVVAQNGYKYKVVTMLSFENFPVKSYGNITLPQGKYEAYRIIIGSGKGQNWWCVMFPPLCFVDLTKGEVAVKETENTMKTVLNKDEFAAVDDKHDTKEIKIRFKIVELFKELKNKLKSINNAKNI